MIPKKWGTSIFCAAEPEIGLDLLQEGIPVQQIPKANIIECGRNCLAYLKKLHNPIQFQPNLWIFLFHPGLWKKAIVYFSKVSFYIFEAEYHPAMKPFRLFAAAALLALLPLSSFAQQFLYFRFTDGSSGLYPLQQVKKLGFEDNGLKLQLNGGTEYAREWVAYPNKANPQG